VCKAQGLDLRLQMSNTQFVIRALIFSLAGSILVFLGVGQLLTDEWTVSTTKRMNASPAAIADAVQDLRRWDEWSAMRFTLGSPTRRTYEGEPGAPGQVEIWSGPLGRATVTLDAVTESGVDYRILFGTGSGEEAGTFKAGGKFTGSIRWEPAESAVDVTWTERGEMSSTIQRWSSWFGALQLKVQTVQRSSLHGLSDVLSGEAK